MGTLLYECAKSPSNEIVSEHNTYVVNTRNLIQVLGLVVTTVTITFVVEANPTVLLFFHIAVKLSAVVMGSKNSCCFSLYYPAPFL